MAHLLYAAEQTSNFLVKAGLAKQAPNFSNVFDARFVKAYVNTHKS